MGPHYNLLNTGFLIFKKTSPEEEEEEERKKNKEGFRVASGDKLTEATAVASMY